MFSLTIKEIPTISTSIFKQVLLSYILVLLNSAESQIELGFCLKKKKNLISINRVAKRNRNKMLQKTKNFFCTVVLQEECKKNRTLSLLDLIFSAALVYCFIKRKSIKYYEVTRKKNVSLPLEIFSLSVCRMECYSKIWQLIRTPY